MTRAKNDPCVSEKRYCATAGSHNKARRAAMTSKEITTWFVAWGIIGKRRQINPVIRLMPYFDRGPGPTAEKGHATDG